jgi:transcriptional regulator with XRE-family HTH domain
MEHTEPFDLELLVAEHIRMQRARAQITLRELSELTGISYPSLSRIERAERPITIGQLVLIAEALNTDMETLLEGTK